MTVPGASSESQNDDSHVVVLWGAGCELSCSSHDVGNDFASVAPLCRTHRGDQTFFSPFFQRGIHSFADAVGENHQEIAGSERKLRLLVGALRDQSDDGTTLVEPFDFLATEARYCGGVGGCIGCAREKKQRCAMAAVHIGEPARGGIELRVEKSGVAIRLGSFV